MKPCFSVSEHWLIGEYDSSASRAQGTGCSPQRNQGKEEPKAGDIRGGEYPVSCARAPNVQTPLQAAMLFRPWGFSAGASNSGS